MIKYVFDIYFDYFYEICEYCDINKYTCVKRLDSAVNTCLLVRFLKIFI